jgi:hypothetical protein
VSTAAVDPQKTRDITEGDSYDIEYSYSVKWKPVTIKFSDRMDRYSRYSFLPQHLEVRSTPQHGTAHSARSDKGDAPALCLDQEQEQDTQLGRRLAAH